MKIKSAIIIIMKKVLSSLILIFLVLFSTYGASKNLKREKEIIYEVLSTQYAGFEDMTKKGFTKRKLKSAHDYEQLKDLLHTYINDSHLNILIDDERIFSHAADSDTTNKSTDPANLFFYKETSNTLYIRCNDCTDSTPEYQKLGSSEFAFYRAELYDYIVLDFRSNAGGSDHPQMYFFYGLNKCNYNGTIIIVQDRWCFSSGEIYRTFYATCKDKFDMNKAFLVGTNSGGAQLYGNCILVEKENVRFFLPTTRMDDVELIEKYEGEGKGYKPDIYATKENLKEVIENLGADLSGIEFR